VEERFLRPAHRATLLRGKDPAELLQRMGAWRPVVVEKWIDRASA
jgi:hypothetical protein